MLQVLPQPLDPDLAGDQSRACGKGMSAEDQVSNGSRHRKAGTKVPWCLGNVHALNAYL